MTIEEIRKTYHGVSGILTHFHILYDPYLGLDQWAIKITPCACIDNINAMDLPWDPYLEPRYQTRHYSVIKWKYDPISRKITRI